MQDEVFVEPPIVCAHRRGQELRAKPAEQQAPGRGESVRSQRVVPQRVVQVVVAGSAQAGDRSEPIEKRTGQLVRFLDPQIPQDRDQERTRRGTLCLMIAKNRTPICAQNGTRIIIA